jgi:hypothetical protein
VWGRGWDVFLWGGTLSRGLLVLCCTEKFFFDFVSVILFEFVFYSGLCEF